MKRRVTIYSPQLSALTNGIRTAGAVSLNLVRLENYMIAREVSRTDG